MSRKGLALVLATLTLALSSCSRELTPTSPRSEGSVAGLRQAAPMAVASQALVRGYNVHYDGRSVAGGQTTFTYTVSGTGVDPALSNFTIQLPDCAPVLASSAPSGGTIGTDPNSGLYGVKWNLSLGTTASRTYSITFAGDVPEGLVRVAVKAGNGFEIAVMPGPCGGFVIAGTVFVDSDANGSWDPADEPGILPGVTVTLVDDQGSESVVTDANGHYSFTRLDGTYTVRIDPATPSSDFNEELFESFSATGPTTIEVTLGPDATGVDFGFSPLTRKLITDFDLGVLTSTGMPASFWTKALRAAQRGGSYQGYDAATLQAMLSAIEGAFFPNPYQFTNGAEFKEALAIVTSKSKDPAAILHRELFVAELNHFGGKGIVGHPDLMEVLLSYGESLLINTTASAARSGVTAAAGSTDLSDASELYQRINNARGGGDVPQ